MKPVCLLENGQFCWVLRVDGHEIMFETSRAADYFERHYRTLGYEVRRITTYGRNLQPEEHMRLIKEAMEASDE